MKEEIKNENKKRLSPEAVEAIKEVAEKISSENVQKIFNDIEEELSNKIVNTYFMSLKKLNKEDNEIKRKMTERILKRYFPLKNEIEIMEKTMFNKENLEKCENDFIERLMVTQFKEITTVCEKNYDNYLGLKQIFSFLDGVIEKHINFLNEEINSCEKLYEKEVNQRILDSIDRDERKIFILENYYKKNWSAKKVKLEIYENERRFLYDKNELLDEMSEYLSGIIRNY